MSGKFKKVIWLILMAELVIIHIALLSKLYLHGYKNALLVFAVGSLVMGSVQYLSYRTFVKNCAKNISRLEGDNIKVAAYEAIRETENDIDKVRIYENSETTTPFVMDCKLFFVV